MTGAQSLPKYPENQSTDYGAEVQINRIVDEMFDYSLLKLPILKLAKMSANLKGSSQEFYNWD